MIERSGEAALVDGPRLAGEVAADVLGGGLDAAAELGERLLGRRGGGERATGSGAGAPMAGAIRSFATLPLPQTAQETMPAAEQPVEVGARPEPGSKRCAWSQRSA